MTTLAISISGSGIMADAAQSFGVADSDLQSILDWGASAFNGYIQATFNAGNSPGFVPTNTEIFQAIANNWKTGVQNAVMNFKTVPPVVPADIVFSG